MQPPVRISKTEIISASPSGQKDSSACRLMTIPIIAVPSAASAPPADTLPTETFGCEEAIIFCCPLYTASSHPFLQSKPLFFLLQAYRPIFVGSFM